MPTDENKSVDSLAKQNADYVVTAARAALGAVPFAGSLLSEIAGTLIPNQRIERIVSFAKELETNLAGIEQRFVRSQLTNENFTDLVEEGLHQAARAVSDERRSRIAALIANGLRTQNISYVESKHLLRILGEVNDIEIIRLASHRYETMGSGQDYFLKHSEVLEPVLPTMGSPQEEIDKATLQESYDEHLAQLGLLRAMFQVDSRTKLPELDRLGAQKIMGYELSSLGRLMLRQLGFSDEDAD
jgi:hypothetical protein